MRTSVLTPKGVRYDLDKGARPPRPWALVFGFALLVAILTAGSLAAYRGRQRVRTPGRASVASADSVPAARTLPVAPTTAATGIVNRLSFAADADLRRALEGAEAACRADDYLSARRRYLEILARLRAGDARTHVERRLGEVGCALVFTTRSMPGKVEHKVQPGESVDRIARLHGVTRELLLKANDIRVAERIQAGKRLQVLEHPRWAVEVRRHSGQLRLYLNGELLKCYAVSVGLHGETPAGTFVVRSRQERPDWWRADGRKVPYGHRENILGTRWMSLAAVGGTPSAKGFGIHGTWSDESVGSPLTAGCIRMRNPDVEELCVLVGEGTPVSIAD